MHDTKQIQKHCDGCGAEQVGYCQRCLEEEEAEMKKAIASKDAEIARLTKERDAGTLMLESSTEALKSAIANIDRLIMSTDAEITRLREALEEIQYHGTDLPAASAASEDYQDGYSNGVRSYALIARQALGGSRE